MTYKIDIRSAVINYYEFHKDRNTIMNIVKEIGIIFNISQRTFFNWKKTIKIKKQGRKIGSGKITSDIEKYIVKRFISNDKPKIINLRRSIKRNFGVSIQKSIIYNVLHKNNITYKKASINKFPHSEEKLKEEKKRVIKETNNKCNEFKDNLISIDEFSVSLEDASKRRLWGLSNKRVYLKINGQRMKQLLPIK